MLSCVVIVFAAVASSCGTEDPFVPFESLVADSLLAVSDPNALQFSVADAECVAAQVVEGIGEARLREIALVPSDGPDAEESDSLQDKMRGMTDEDVEAFAGAIETCVDLEANVAGLLERSGVPPEVSRCVAEKYVSDDISGLALRSRGHDPELNDRIDQVLMRAGSECGA